jgi:nucleoside-diphosphate-sugar epimerase
LKNNYPEYFNSEIELDEIISQPNAALIKMMKEIDGDFIFLGVAGKIGISLATMAKRACVEAGVNKKIIGVSRFSSGKQKQYLEEKGIEVIKGDLTEQEFINSLPKVKNVIYLAGVKFGTDGNEATTWVMNSYLPGLVSERFKNSRILAFSTGCVYPLVDIISGGSKESDFPEPIGEYAQSCLGRERVFEYGSIKNKTEIILIRLNYAVEMRYGVLVDVATKVFNEEAVDLEMGYANVIWQGDANTLILQAMQLCQSPAKHLNISGAEIISIREVALRFGDLMNKKVIFTGKEAENALLINVSESHKLLGKPTVQLEQVIDWTANWIMNKKATFGKPTHFQVRDGVY